MKTALKSRITMWHHRRLSTSPSTARFTATAPPMTPRWIRSAVPMTATLSPITPPKEYGSTISARSSSAAPERIRSRWPPAIRTNTRSTAAHNAPAASRARNKIPRRKMQELFPLFFALDDLRHDNQPRITITASDNDIPSPYRSQKIKPERF